MQLEHLGAEAQPLLIQHAVSENESRLVPNCQTDLPGGMYVLTKLLISINSTAATIREVMEVLLRVSVSPQAAHSKTVLLG